MLSRIKALLKKPVDVRKSWVEQPMRFGDDMLGFLNWFDQTRSIEHCLERARGDWRDRFASTEQFKAVSKGKALEIGFGGGRLLANAAKDFEHAYGVDIHAGFDMTRKFLAMQDVSNFTLLKRDELGQIPDQSIDFVYSFIVFQHFDSLEEVRYYLNHIRRVLKPTGYAHLYIGKNKEKGVKVVTAKDFRVRDCSLFVEPAVMHELLGKDFEIVELKDRLMRLAEDGGGESGQFYVIFKPSRPRA